MDSPEKRTLAVAVLFLLGTLATPVHLLVDAHELSHHESPEPEDHEHSHHEPHPASDHEVVPLSSAARPAPVTVEVVAVEFEIPAPEIPTWTPTIDAEANSPPSSPEAPPRCPRAPPV